MANKKGLKGALVSSIVAVALSCTTFVGTTFAWFTDSVTSTGNVIQSGTLEVGMYWAEGKNRPESASWTDASRGAIFNYAKWEPGYVQARHIKISNLGTLAMKYQLAIIPNGTVSALAEVIDVYFSDPAEQVSRATATTGTYVGTLKDVIGNGIASGYLPAEDNSTATIESVRTVTIVLKMREEAGNEYQGLSIGSNFAVQLVATQYEAEEDSFDNQYDEDAWHPDMQVRTAADLQSALNNGSTNITLMNDIVADESIVIPAPATTTFSLRTVQSAIEIDLNGKKISSAENMEEPVILNKGVLNLKNGTINAVETTAIRNDGAAGYLILDDINIAQTIAINPEWLGSAVFTSNGATTVINSGNYKGVSSAAIVATSGGHLIINDGTFEANVTTIRLDTWSSNSFLTINNGTFNVAVEGAKALYADGYKAADGVNINGGVFNGSLDSTYTNININGGTFNKSIKQPGGHQNYYYISGGTFVDDLTVSISKNTTIEEGYKAVDNGDGTYVVVNDTLSAVAGYAHLYTDGTNYYVYDAIGLISMRDYWKANWCNNAMWGKSYNVMADIDATGYTWDEVYVNVGNNDNLGFTFDGHGHTITGLNINGSLFTGTPNGGNKPQNPGIVQNITFDGVKVKGGHDAAVVWGNLYNELVVSNVKVINSTIVGDCNVGALVGRTTMETSPDASVKFVDCTVANNTIIANGKEGQDPNGANAFVSRAYSNTTVTFEGENAAENNVIENKNGLVGGGIYGYTTWANGGFAGTGTSEDFANWNGVTAAPAGTALSASVINSASEVVLGEGTYTLPAGITTRGVIIVGNGENTVFDFTKVNNANGASITFENIHFQSKNENVMNGFGIQSTTGKIVYKNCTFDGAVTNEYAGEVEYIDCTFTGTGYITTYAVSKATFVNCVFDKADSRAILVYSHGDNPCQVTVSGCTFKAAAKGTTWAGDWTAAIEIDTTNIPTSGTSVTIENSTADSNYSGIYRDKSASGKANAVITVK